MVNGQWSITSEIWNWPIIGEFKMSEPFTIGHSPLTFDHSPLTYFKISGAAGRDEFCKAAPLSLKCSFLKKVS
jgi:hypothetical protein